MYNKILIVDDDVNICEMLTQFLEKEGYSAVSCNDGDEALEMAKRYDPDIILLDIMLPGKSGKNFCTDFRKTSKKPVIMITAKTSVVDKVVCLELGADDFVTKPFDMNELFARIKAVLRRTSEIEEEVDQEVLKFDNIEISSQKYELKIRGRCVDVPPKELELLYFLASNYNHVFTRDQLLDKVWGFDYLGDSRTVDVHVKRLREKLDGASDKWQLKTVWGVGYKFEVV